MGNLQLSLAPQAPLCQLIYTISMARFTEVMFEGELTCYSSTSTLAEIAEDLAARDPNIARLIRFKTLTNGQLIGIGSDAVLRALRDSTQGEFRLMAQVRAPSVASSRAASEQAKSRSDVMSVAGLREAKGSDSALRYQLFYNGLIGGESFLWLKGQLSALSLFEVSQQILAAASGLPADSYTCYLYNKWGWPLAADIEQSMLICGNEYLVNGDFVFALVWKEQPPRKLNYESYESPGEGELAFCFEYQGVSWTVKLQERCPVGLLRRKILWLLRIPLNLIVIEGPEEELRDDYEITATDVEEKQLTVAIGSLTASFSQVADIYSDIHPIETRKLYSHFHLLLTHTPSELKSAVALAAYLLAQKWPPFLFSFYQLLQGSSLTKAERVAVASGCVLMQASFPAFLAPGTAIDTSHMIARLYHLAYTSSEAFKGLISVVDCGDGKEGRFGVSDDPVKEARFINVLKYSHLTLPKVVISAEVRNFADYLLLIRANPPFSFESLSKLVETIPFLPILHPSDITNTTKDRLTYHPTGQLWISRGLDSSKNLEFGEEQQVLLSDVLTGEWLTIKKKLLTEQVERHFPRQVSGRGVIREPEEAIVVVFDTSWSMNSRYESNDTKTRLDAAKTFFLLFAQRTQAYDFPHVFSLCTFAFAGSTHFRFDFTENLSSFLELVERLTPLGLTALYSTMEQGLSKLQLIKQQYPKVRLRMMIISDGEDNDSMISAKTIANLAVQREVVVDVFAVGGKCPNLKLISKLSGGFCYFTATIIEGVTTFEAETILKLSLRQPQICTLPWVANEKEFAKLAETIPFDTQVPPMLQPPDINDKLCSSIRAFELQAAGRTGNPLAGKRVLRELVRYNHDPHPDYDLFPLSRNLFVWRGIVQGPPETPYEYGLFDFYINFGEGYPGKAPEMRFLTPIEHSNITKNGRICHPIFNTNYTTETSIRDILNSVYSLLLMQDFDDYIVSNLHITLSYDQEQFRAKARESTLRYAIRGKTTTGKGNDGGGGLS